MNETPSAPPLDSWQPDVLGEHYQKLTIALGADPDGEGPIEATLVRHAPPVQPAEAPSTATTGAVLYVHGFTDYFFQTHLAAHFSSRGYRFYALDLRKCGRSTGNGQRPHYARDFAIYDEELNQALRLIRAETGLPVLVAGHSTGGLIVPLWLNRLRRSEGVAAAGVNGVVLNSPWLDLQGPPMVRSIGTVAIKALGRVLPTVQLPGNEMTTYGDSLHTDTGGEWDYDLTWKPLAGFPIRLGWLRAVRIAQAQLHRGVNIEVPALVLRSKTSRFVREYHPTADTADIVLDVRQIQRWSGCLGQRVTVVPIDGARHDVFLSTALPRKRAFAELDAWLDQLPDIAPPVGV